MSETKKVISDEAVEAAVHAYMQYPRTRGMSNTEDMFRAALEAAAPYIAERAYNAGHLDGMMGAPNTNPYRSQA